MAKKLKDNVLLPVSILAIVILLAKISNWIFNYDGQTVGVINTVMFVFLGVIWLIFGFFSDNRKTGAILIACGLYLIAWSFLPENDFFNVAGILCLVVPVLIGRFRRGENDMEEIA
ncbi:MAG: hypothetical protein KA780_06930 [Prolixibacteraceae bacterium]|mgnify:FL=1|jgi:uncharacterized membrane protein|nr:hypothetical protein [Prolixibacteraceae bacterium]NLX28069.1 hypothetical protein [Bacteroidales bacterium]HRV89841.1 hypothetical protein [Prolixibacteraceae bacterium]